MNQASLHVRIARRNRRWAMLSIAVAMFSVGSAALAEEVHKSLVEGSALSPSLQHEDSTSRANESAKSTLPLNTMTFDPLSLDAMYPSSAAEGTGDDLRLSSAQSAAWLSEAENDGDTQASDLAARLDALESKYNELQDSHSDLMDSHNALQESFAENSLDGDGDAPLTVYGRIHIDMWQYPHTTPGVNGFETGDIDIPPQDRIGFRRLRIGVQGDIAPNMLYRVETEFADGQHFEFRDAYMGFTDLPLLQTLVIGNQKRPYGLDHWNSSRYNVFLERPFIIEEDNPGSRRLGVQSWSYSDDLVHNWQYGVFNSANVQPTGSYTSDHWQPQLAGRFANTLGYDECEKGRNYVHWAVAGSWVDTDGNANTPNYADSGVNTAQFRTRPEAWTHTAWLNTDLIEGSRNYTLLGLENVINLGPVQIVGEYQNVWLNRAENTQLNFHGGYGYISYFLTGEHMPWNREIGALDRPIPFENFVLVDTCRDDAQPGCGAWQVAVRWSYGDLSDQELQGGIGESVTFGLNWYWNPRARMQFNAIYGNIHDNALNAVDGIDYGDYLILGTRFMIDF